MTQDDSPVMEPSAPEAERRQLTVMFCDLVGSTELSSRLDPEELRDVIRAYQSVSTEVLERYEGYIAQHLGDGLMVYFGWPQAHEDDIQRAVHAGLGIVEAMGPLNERLEHDKGVRLAVRIGIHTGPVVIGKIGSGASQEQLALGETPNVAARIQGLAETDTVVLSAAAYGLVQGYFECEDLGEQELRGVAEPVGVYRVLRESGAQSRLEITPTLTPLVGREQEVGLLLDCWKRAKNGQGQVVLLSGEAGIGKSRLVQVLKDRAAHESIPLECRSSPYYQNTALYPLINLLQRTLQWQPNDYPEEKLAKLEQVLGQHGLPLEETIPLFAPLLSLSIPEDRYLPLNLSPQRHRQKTLETIIALVLALSEQQPVLFIVEDLHWLDPTSLELLDLLINQTPTAALCVLLTCRPTFQPPWGSRSYLTPMTLHRLSQSQVAQMAEHVVDGERLPAEMLQQIIEKTDGVPLFVEEMTKAILESGYLKEVDGHYELTEALSALAIPSTLQDSLMARLDRLVTAKGIAQMAATIGRQFSYELLEALAQIDASTLQRELGRLVEAELVYQRGLPPQATYLFKHALVQDAAYESLLKSTRQQYHQRIAQVLEAQFPETVETQAELVAHHYTEANSPEQAIEWWQRAGENAYQRSSYAESIAHLTRGLEVLAAFPDIAARVDREIRLRLVFGRTLLYAKGHGVPEVAQNYFRLRELCHQVDDLKLHISTLLGLRIYYDGRAEHRKATEVAQETLQLVQGSDDPALLASAHYNLGASLYYRGMLPPALDHLEQSLAIWEPLPVVSRTDRVRGTSINIVQAYACMALWTLGYLDQAQRRCEQAFHFSQDARTADRGFVQLWAVLFHAARRDWATLHKAATRLTAFGTEQSMPQLTAVGAMMLGWWRVVRRQDHEGMVQLHQGMQDFRNSGGELYRPYWLSRLAEAQAQLGNLQEALDTVAEAIEVMHTTEAYLHHAGLYCLNGTLLLTCPEDRHAEAESCFHQALEITRSQQAKSWELRSATSLARLWQSQAKPQDAYELLMPVHEWFTEGFDTADLREAKGLLDELSEDSTPPTT